MTPRLRPRPIANLSPLVAAYLGPRVYQAQKALAECWHWQRDPIAIFEKNGRILHMQLVAGSAMTDQDLSHWMESVLARALPDHMYIIVAGDDMLALIFDFYCKMTVIEADMGKYDRTKQQGVLDVQYLLFCVLGLARHDVALLKTCSKAPYLMISRNHNDLAQVIRDRTQFTDTGGTDTTVGNSAIEGVASANNLVNQWLKDGWASLTVQSVIDEYALLGFEAKVKVHNKVTEGTFLKGMWYPVDKTERWSPDYYWGPLPSRICKMGKSQRHPCELYKTAEGFENASRCFLNDIANSYAYFVEVPFIRTFVQSFRTGPAVYDLWEEWKISAAKVRKPKLDQEAVKEQICERYQISADQFLSFEQILPRKAFVFTEHPVAWSLMSKDYA